MREEGRREPGKPVVTHCGMTEVGGEEGVGGWFRRNAQAAAAGPCTRLCGRYTEFSTMTRSDRPSDHTMAALLLTAAGAALCRPCSGPTLREQAV